MYLFIIFIYLFNFCICFVLFGDLSLCLNIHVSCFLGLILEVWEYLRANQAKHLITCLT